MAMTIDEAIRCMKAYLPDGGLDECYGCPYFNSNQVNVLEFCRNEEAHKLAIKALERMKEDTE